MSWLCARTSEACAVGCKSSSRLGYSTPCLACEREGTLRCHTHHTHLQWLRLVSTGRSCRWQQLERCVLQRAQGCHCEGQRGRGRAELLAEGRGGTRGRSTSNICMKDSEEETELVVDIHTYIHTDRQTDRQTDTFVLRQMTYTPSNHSYQHTRTRVWMNTRWLYSPTHCLTRPLPLYSATDSTH